MKIENKSVARGDSRRSQDFEDFVVALQKLKVGQSFYLEGFASNYRMTISICRILLGREFASRKEGNGYRVGRIK